MANDITETLRQILALVEKLPGMKTLSINAEEEDVRAMLACGAKRTVQVTAKGVFIESATVPTPPAADLWCYVAWSRPATDADRAEVARIEAEREAQWARVIAAAEVAL